MRAEDRLAAFVREALAAGHGRAEISARLQAAGWSRPEIDGALAQWADDGFALPVPRPHASLTARDAFRHALMFTALGVVLGFAVSLGFALIETWLPDPADNIAPLARRMRWPIATLAVFLPLFLVLDHRAARAARSDLGQRRSGVRAWLGHIALFLAALTLLGDAMATVYAFLSGDLTLRFVAKATLVAGLAGLVFLYIKGLMRPDPAELSHAR